MDVCSLGWTHYSSTTMVFRPDAIYVYVYRAVSISIQKNPNEFLLISAYR